MTAQDILLANVREYIHEQKHFTARWLRQIKTQSGIDVDVEIVAQCIAGATCLLLVRGEQSQFVCNFLCIVVPLIVTYLYPKERPQYNLLLIYWATFSGVTLLDNGLSSTIPAYFIFKIIGMICMFLKPLCGAQKILEIIEKSKIGVDFEDQDSGFSEEELNALKKARVKKSPPPEKPEGEEVSKNKTESTVKSNKSFSSTKSKTSKSKNKNLSDSNSNKHVKETVSKTISESATPNSISKSNTKIESKQPASPPVKTTEEDKSIDSTLKPQSSQVYEAKKQPSPPKIEKITSQNDDVAVSPKAPEVVPLPKKSVSSKVGDDSTRATSVYVKMQSEGGGAYDVSKGNKNTSKPKTPPAETSANQTTKSSQNKMDDSSRQTASMYVKLQSEGEYTTPSKTNSKPSKSNDDSSRQTASTYQLLASEGGGVYGTKNDPKTDSKFVKKNDDSSRQTASTYQLLPSEGGGAYAKSNSQPTTPKHKKASKNPSIENLKSTESTISVESGISNKVNSDDLIFTPEKQIIINGPFNNNSLTSHMTLKNNSKKHIAYAIKSNAVPRISCVPASGVIKPNEKHTIDVNVTKFDISENNHLKDRVSFEYVFCPPDTTAFTHSLLQSNEIRRRKKIKIVYNA